MPSQRQCSKTIILLLSSIILSTRAVIDYSSYGANWPNLLIDNNECGKDYQSPIDLRYTFREVPYAEDKLFKHYEDISSTNIKWSDQKFTTVVALPAEQKVTGFIPNYFISSYFSNKLAETDSLHPFKAVQFHFHAKSEHTIEGKQFGFEMHTVHLLDPQPPDNIKQVDGFFASAMGIIFDPYDYDSSVTDDEVAIIDAFFESLQMGKLSNANPTVDITSVPYGQLMNMVRTDKRWVYKGSLTTPPCTQKIYWNVVSKVYPIKQEHLDQFKKLLRAEEVAQPNKMKLGGNYREVQPFKKQDPFLMVPPEPPVVVEDPNQGEKSASVLLVCLLLCLLINGGISYVWYQKRQEDDEKEKNFKEAQQSLRPSMFVEDKGFVSEYITPNTPQRKQEMSQRDANVQPEVELQSMEQNGLLPQEVVIQMKDPDMKVLEPEQPQILDLSQQQPQVNDNQLSFEPQQAISGKEAGMLEGQEPAMSSLLEVPGQPDYQPLPNDSVDVNIRQENASQNMVMMSSANFGSDDDEQQRKDGVTNIEKSLKNLLSQRDMSPAEAIQDALFKKQMTKK